MNNDDNTLGVHKAAQRRSLPIAQAIGIVMLLFGLAYGLGAVLPEAGVAGLLAAVIWALSEIFARRMRLALPSFVLSVAFTPVFLFAVLEAMAVGPLVSGSTGLFEASAAAAIVPALIGVGGAVMHYWRFGVPVGAMGIAGSLLFLAAILLDTALPGVLEAHLAWFTLAAGAATFMAAMWFDSRDVARVTTASDKAFWLHLLAAPLLVHSILTLATGGDFVINLTSWTADSVKGRSNIFGRVELLPSAFAAVEFNLHKKEDDGGGDDPFDNE